MEAPDLLAATEAARAEGLNVVLVEQPYRVAGRRSPAPAAQLDVAWTAVVEALRGEVLSERPLVVGGRSLGARVACRTAEAVGAVAVLCLAFPLEPPARAGKPRQSRLAELDVFGAQRPSAPGHERRDHGLPVRLPAEHARGPLTHILVAPLS